MCEAELLVQRRPQKPYREANNPPCRNRCWAGRSVSEQRSRQVVVPQRTLRIRTTKALPFQGSSAVTSGGQLKYWPRDSLRVNCRSCIWNRRSWALRKAEQTLGYGLNVRVDAGFGDGPLARDLQLQFEFCTASEVGLSSQTSMGKGTCSRASLGDLFQTAV